MMIEILSFTGVKRTNTEINVAYICLTMQMIVGQKKQVGKISNDRQMKKINTHHKGKVYSACIKYITKQ